jgi:hypothetical protein
VRIFCLVLGLVFELAGIASARAAQSNELTACSVVSAGDAEKFVGGKLQVTKIDKKIILNAPWSHDSICTYISEGANVADPASASRFLDVNLRFFPSPETARSLHDISVEQFRKFAASPDTPFKFTQLAPLDGFGGSVFLIEVLADPGSDYKSAQVLFYKGSLGGSISAWKKPDSSVETTKLVLKHILSQLP